MARCYCDDGETTCCTRLCGHCGGCLRCSVNRESGKCNCVYLKPDCKHRAFNSSFPDCACDDGQITVCTRLCGHCGGCLRCSVNRESGKCNCVYLKPDCKHRAFNSSFPDCACDDGQITVCTRLCGHCGGCLRCSVNRESGKCNCVYLKPDCKHRAFNSSFPDCACDDGQITVCMERCGHCGGCLSCSVNRESGKCNCAYLKPDCKHRAFNSSFPDCACDDGETTCCTRRCGHCGGCLSCSVNRESGKCNCIYLKPDCKHRAFNRSFPDCACDDGQITVCMGRCGHCGGCLSCSVNRESGKCNCINLKSDCEHAAFNSSFPDCACDDGETTCCTRLCGHCGGCLSCSVNQESGECNCIYLKPDCEHRAFNPLFPDCPCDDGEFPYCTRYCKHCDGCLSCNVNREGGDCYCASLEPNCEHKDFNPLFPDCPCDDGENTVCTQCCEHCDGCLSCNVNRESGVCNCPSLDSDCQHVAVKS